MNKFIRYMNAHRPERCNQCNCCRRRPVEDVPKGSRKTHYCLLLKKELSGKTISSLDKRNYQRCHPEFYDKQFRIYTGELELSAEEFYKYNCESYNIPGL